VEYVPPVIFDDAYIDFTFDLTVYADVESQKTLRNVFIDGASGSGKTRFGYELYKRLAREKQADKAGQLKTDFVSYAMITMPPNNTIDPMDTEGAGRILAQLLIRQYTKLQEVVLHDHFTLSDAINCLARRQLTPEQRANPHFRVALVLHIDEFQISPNLAAAMLRAIRDKNKSTASTRMLILPVLTGLYSSQTTSILGPYEISGVQSRIHRLNFFKSKDLASVWNIVRSAAKVNNQHLILPARLEDQPPFLQYLVEDVRGWPVAAVQLGGVLGLLSLTQEWTYKGLEATFLKVMTEKYSRGVFARALGVSETTGLQKLFLLALSPHKVRLPPVNMG